MRRAILLALAGCAGACSLDLGVPADVTVTCTTNAECPSGTICDTNANKCVASETPSLFIGVPDDLTTRYTRAVPFTLSVVSANAGARFDVVIEFRLADGDASTWLPMTLASSSAATSGISGSPSGSSYAFVWDALTDATYANGLTLARVDLDGNGEVADPIVRTARVIIRVTAKNDNGSVASTPSESAPFSIGNDPPTATIVDAIGDSGVINVIVGLEDSSADVCGFELEFRGPDGVWRAAALSYGTVDALGCLSDKPLDASVGWSSRAPLYDPAAQPVTTPQGVGNVTIPNGTQSARILLRARAYDNAEASEKEYHWGLWSPPHVLAQVVNQTSPVVVDATAPRTAVIGGTSPVHIRYTLVDAESDTVNASIDFSNDAGATWTPAREYPFAMSEGLQGLATAPLTSDGTGGVEHLFTWDASAVNAAAPESTMLRITADDGASTPTSIITGLAAPAGPSGIAPHDAFAHTLFSRSLFNSNGTTATCCVSDVAFADFNNDGSKDMAFAKDGSDALTIVRNTGATVPWAESYLTGAVELVVAADFTHSGNQSLVGITTSGGGTLWRGNGNATFTSDSTFSVGAACFDAAAADFDGDGYADLVVTENNLSSVSLAVFMNTGTTGAHFGSSSFQQSFSAYIEIAVADFDGDGLSDIAYLGEDENGAVLGSLGNGSFSQIGAFGGSVGFQDRGLAAGDVNGDGIVDLVNVESDTLTYDLGGGTAPNLSYTSVVVGGFGVDLDQVEAVELNGDGLTDVVLSSSSSTSYLVALSLLDAAGNLAPPFRGSIAIGNSGVFAGDLDGDGIAELVPTFTNGPATFAVQRADGPSTVGGQMFRPGPPASPVNGGGTPVLANLDSDGIPDIAYIGQTLLVRRGSGFGGVGDGSFEPEEQTFWQTSINAFSAVAADVDNDGALDLLFLSQDSTNNVMQLGYSLSRTVQGVADARFAEPTMLTVGTYSGLFATAIAAADFDADGAVDVAYLYSTDGGSTFALGVAFNRGGGFTVQDATYALASFPGRLTIGYVGPDALPDVVVTLSENDVVHVLNNAVSPVSRSNPFAATDVPVGIAPGFTRPMDVNWDGVADLVVPYETFLGIRNGIASGGFQAETDYFVEASFRSAMFFDATLDGINDFVFLQVPASQNVSEVALGQTAAGVPNGTFAATPATYDGAGAENIWVRDFNCDAVTDYGLGLDDESVLVMARERDLFTPSLAMTVVPYTGKHDTLLAGVGFGGPMPAHPWQIAGGAPCHANERWEDALRVARAQAGASPRFKPLATARWLGETIRYKRTVIGEATRWQRSSRFSPALDLTTSGAPRGLVATLPVFPGLRAGVDTSKLRVYVQLDSLSTAADVADDLLHTDPAAATLLPQVLGSSGLTDVIQRGFTWEQIPVDGDGNLSTGTGRRYLYDAASGHIDILTDTGGFYVAVQEL